jgi:hypothetical protein
MPKKHIVKLDVERELVFTMPAIAELDSVCGINLMATDTYSDFSPRKLCDLIWAAQLHTKKPLARHLIPKYVPTGITKYRAMLLIVSEAIYEALSDETAKAPGSE